MVVAVIPLANKFKPRRAIAKIEPFNHPHLFQQMRRAIDRGRIASVSRHGAPNLLDRQWVRMFAQYFQNGLARPGHVA